MTADKEAQEGRRIHRQNATALANELDRVEVELAAAVARAEEAERQRDANLRHSTQQFMRAEEAERQRDANLRHSTQQFMRAEEAERQRDEARENAVQAIVAKGEAERRVATLTAALAHTPEWCMDEDGTISCHVCYLRQDQGHAVNCTRAFVEPGADGITTGVKELRAGQTRPWSEIKAEAGIRRVATLEGWQDWALKLCGVVFAPEPCETHCARDRAAYLLAEAPDVARAALSVEPEKCLACAGRAVEPEAKDG